MPKFEVRIPVVAIATYQVEAKDEKEAIEIAMGEEINMEDLDEVEQVLHVSEGNVCYAPLNSAEALQLSGDDDDADTDPK